MILMTFPLLCLSSSATIRSFYLSNTVFYDQIPATLRTLPSASALTLFLMLIFKFCMTTHSNKIVLMLKKYFSAKCFCYYGSFISHTDMKVASFYHLTLYSKANKHIYQNYYFNFTHILYKQKHLL